MNGISLALNQIRFELRTFRRNRSALMFTFLFPIMFLVIFSINASGRTAQFKGGTVPFIQFFVPGIIAYGIIGACYTNMAMRISILRDTGVLKRVRGTPLSTTSYLAGHVGTSVVIGIALASITLTAGMAIYHVQLYTHTLLAMVTTLITGGAAFCAVGLAIAQLVPNADAAPAIVNFTMFPILFISDVFYSVEDAPHWIKTIASIFPIKHFANALQVTFDPRTTGMGFSPQHLGIVVGWGVLATAFALRNFRWESNSTH